MGPTLGKRYYYYTIRLLRSYLPVLPREKEILYQGLGYWIKSNWKLFDITKNPVYKKDALACSDFIVDSQSKEGNWPYPQRLIKCNINTNNGTWASLGLLESYKRTRNEKYLSSALEWYNLLTNVVGFQKYKDALSINYAKPPIKKVPNNTSFNLWFFAELSNLTNDLQYMQYTRKMIRFLEYTQMKNGELMYHTEKPHYLCFNYNSFEFLDLLEFYKLTNDNTVHSIMQRLIEFVSTGVNKNGSVRFNCFKKHPIIIYYSASVGCALLQATKMDFGDFMDLEREAYEYVLSSQKPDGGFPYSRKEYAILSDQTAYPFTNAYILYHLLTKAEQM